MTWATTGRLIDEIRRKHPNQAKAADHENSRRAAIHLFCLECVGGVRAQAAECETFVCPLWTFRPGAGTGAPRPETAVPSVEEYGELITKRARIEGNAAHLAAWREQKKSGKSDQIDLDLAFEGIEDAS